MGFVTFNALRVGVAFGVGYTVGKSMGKNIVKTLELVAGELDKRDLNVFTRLERAVRA